MKHRSIRKTDVPPPKASRITFCTLNICWILLSFGPLTVTELPAAELQPIGDKLVVLTFDDSVKS
ncbi:MAG: hypothetical protein ABGZ17_03130, partial [Planctomycetaceae bacterium]